MNNPSQYLEALVKEFSRLPGIGMKSASRVAFHILEMSDEDAHRLAESILSVKKNVKSCSICGGISDSDICSICGDSSRERSVICVVESKKDVLTIEKTNSFRGLYHVLNGVISPLDGIGPDDLNIRTLLERCRGGVKELILATNPTVEGDATSLYLAKLVSGLEIRITRISRGLPVGADIEYADSATLAKSLKERIPL